MPSKDDEWIVLRRYDDGMAAQIALDFLRDHDVPVGLRGNSGYNLKCYTQPTSGAWHHLVAIYDKSQNAANEVTLYVDGALQTARSQLYSADNSNGFATNPLYLFSAL